jgi:hypothetical protein
MTGPFEVTREFPMEQSIFQVPDVICPESDVGPFTKQFRLRASSQLRILKQIYQDRFNSRLDLFNSGLDYRPNRRVIAG